MAGSVSDGDSGAASERLSLFVIAFSSAVTKPDVYRACAQPGIERAAERGLGGVFASGHRIHTESYNHLLDSAAKLKDLEALVLVHQDAELLDADLCSKLRLVPEDPEVAVIGCAGAVGVRSIAWWEGSVTLASFVNRYREHGGGDLPGMSWDWDTGAAVRPNRRRRDP